MKIKFGNKLKIDLKQSLKKKNNNSQLSQKKLEKGFLLITTTNDGFGSNSHGLVSH